MTKLLQNKTIIKFLGIALSILLIVALVPQINIAYGSKDDVATETPTAETGDNPATEGEEGAEGEELASADEAAIAPTSLADEVTPTPVKARSAVKRRAANLPGGSEITNNNSQVSESDGVLTINGGDHTLTVKGTLKKNIVVEGGANLTIKGTGTIEGIGSGSVIVVEGNSKLILGEKNSDGVAVGPTITKGKGSRSPAKYNDGAGTVGGGIYVQSHASLEMNGGKITENTAGGGGGIFVWTNGHFVMNGGEVSENKALDHEGGGIFTDAKDSVITGGSIINNHTYTKNDWGGGGIYINNNGTLKINSALITKNTADGLGGGIAGCPHAKIVIGKKETTAVGELENSAAVFKNTANGKSYPLNTVLRLNVPKSVVNSNNRIPSGDFFITGMNEDEITKLKGGVNTGYINDDNVLTYPGDKTYQLKYGKYASEHFKVGLAQDYYCTLASYIAPENVLTRDQGETFAWRGFEVSMSIATKAEITENDGLWFREIGIPVGEGYESHDATLCLTSTATKDAPKVTRNVIIKGNTSGTHGGGIACNGAIKFGKFEKEEKTTVNPYTIKLNKKIVNSLGNEVEIAEGESFEFELIDKDNPATKYSATTDEVGNLNFTGIPGYRDEWQKTKEFTLSEKLNADSQKEFTPLQIDVTINLNVTKEVANYCEKDNTVLLTATTYTTKVSKITIGNKVTNEVTNTLNLKAKESIPVTKIANGIGVGSFTFGFKKIDDISDVVDNPSNPTALKQANSLLGIATAEGATVKTTEQLADSTKQAVEGKVSFGTEGYTTPGTYWYAIAEQNGGNQDVVNGVDYDGTTYLVKVDVTLSEDKRSLETSKTIYKAEYGKTDLKNATEFGVKFTNVGMKYAGFNLGLTKQILTTLGENLPLNDRTFSFALYEGENPAAEAKPVAQGTTDPKTGKLNLQITDGKYAKGAFTEAAHEKEFTFTLKETPLEGKAANFMSTIEPATVKVTLSAAGERTTEDGRSIYLVTPTVKTVTVNGTDVEVANNDITVTNRYAPNGSWQFLADKFFYGIGEPSDCSFSLVEIERAPGEDEAVSSIAVKKEFSPLVVSVTKDQLAAGKATIKFPAITYVAEGEGKNQRNDIGDHYYLVTETGDDAARDTTAYVIKVTVAVDDKDPSKLVATKTVRYADDINSPLNPLTLAEGELPAFYNTDTYDMISAASYSVYAASGEPVDQVCYVDPKIIKNLEGRAIKSGEFAFKLIQVANPADTEGEVISAATNDEFGMVDFDKANNKGTLENPTCLAYTAPGTYYYRVIEDTSKGGMKDQSVLYSDQVITFTTVIEKVGEDGKPVENVDDPGTLVCTDMYYGYWDKAANKNVPFKEQYTDYETQPANIGDMSKLNPDWHPTITNKARPMDLQVRKTSVTDRDEGLVGATYALYMVNDNAQGDIWLAEATSEEGGWITYKNVSLSTNNLYYFKETAAPAGHTVSEFRSPYFYLVEDATSPNGYALKYSDTKYFDAANAQADAATQAETTEPLAEVQAVALQNNAAAQAEAAETAAAQAEAAATDDTVQPGHSADGNILLTYDKDGGVYDEATQLEVNKLDTRTHEWVEGAKLVIIEKDSGKEVNSWTSGKAPEKLEKTLNVGTTYLLREVEAPGQYRLANDVEFVIDSYGNVSIVNGTENGNAELSDNTITLYDTMMDAEEVQRRNRETTREVPIGVRLAQTGDWIPLAGIGLIVLVSLIALAVAARRRRSEKDSDN